jgi:hypothetical protein
MERKEFEFWARMILQGGESFVTQFGWSGGTRS